MIQEFLEQAATEAGLAIFTVTFIAPNTFVFEDGVDCTVELLVCNGSVIAIDPDGSRELLFSLESMVNRGLVFTGVEFILS